MSVPHTRSVLLRLWLAVGSAAPGYTGTTPALLVATGSEDARSLYQQTTAFLQHHVWMLSSGFVETMEQLARELADSAGWPGRV